MKNIYLVLTFFLFPFVAFAYNEDEFFGNHMMGSSGWGFWGGGIFMFLFWVLIIIGVIYLIKHFSENGKSSEKGNDRSIEIIKERYAKGEISKEEFEQKKKELKE